MHPALPGGSALAAALALATAAAVPSAFAEGPLLLRIGGHNVAPKSDNGELAGGALAVDVESRPGVTFNVDWYFTPHVALDVLAALPFEHDIRLNGVKAGSARQLPPTVSVQYHFMPSRRFDPFVSAGINYTTFWDTKLDDGTPLDLDDSWGLAAQAGVDYTLDAARRWVVGADIRYIDIDTEASSDGTGLGTVKIDPLAYGMTVGYRF